MFAFTVNERLFIYSAKHLHVASMFSGHWPDWDEVGRRTTHSKFTIRIPSTICVKRLFWLS